VTSEASKWGQCSNWNDVRDSMISVFVLVALVLCLWSFYTVSEALELFTSCVVHAAFLQVAFATPAQLGLGLVTWQQ